MLDRCKVDNRKLSMLEYLHHSHVPSIAPVADGTLEASLRVKWVKSIFDLDQCTSVPDHAMVCAWP